MRGLNKKTVAASIVLIGLGCAALWIAPWLKGRFFGIGENLRPEGYAGSASCRSCHEEFYRKWSTSHHGRAMQIFTAELARQESFPQSEELAIGAYRYRVELNAGEGRVVEKGPQGERRYRLEHALGGKNVYYFLTTLERGRLQTLPLAFDVSRRQWFDTAASGMRHFRDVAEERVFWRDYAYTFNSSCHGCHVSQMSTNYDSKSDTYSTTWAEPGINCETCHGPGEKHVRMAKAATGETALKDPGIIRFRKDLAMRQRNDTCASCHAKISTVIAAFRPGDRFFDRFDLATLESPDFYPDGRDLGENCTQTLWRMNPCAKSGELECTHCHTSSGRNRFAGVEHANDACMPCHEDRVRNATLHTRHAQDSKGNRCTSCHMPMTEFARMRRSDHSFRPPAPAATIAFASPNACNVCHDDKDAAWADQWVRRWHGRDYQAPLLKQGRLIEAARRGNWTNLPDILAAITAKDRDEIFANSLIRLLRSCEDLRKLPALVQALDDSSPLIRASAVEALGDALRPEHIPALIRAARDDYRLVRARAAAVLAQAGPELPSQDMRAIAERAAREYVDSLTARPDDHYSQYNLGNYYMARAEPERAVESFEKALRLEPRFVQALVNSSLAYHALGRNQQALQNLRRALQAAPDNVAAQLNLALLLAELGEHDEAMTYFRKVLERDPKSAVAAYNLGILLAKDRLDEAIEWFRHAFRVRPGGKHGFSLAFYLLQRGDASEAIAVLREAIDREPDYRDTYQLLAEIYRRQGRSVEAAAVLQALRTISRR
jgi:tetratricopeptide (TPR) repeat protein